MTSRAPANPGRDPEYDRFGPWVLEISEDDPPPPLFVPHLQRTEAPLLSVKVPRKIARREAHPGMHLYDYVVSLYEDEMDVLQRVDHDVRLHTFAYRDVKHLRVREELLRGGLGLGVAGESFELPYNTVSSDLIRRVASLIRERFLDPGTAPAMVPPPSDPAELSFYFERLLRDERASGDPSSLLLAQPDLALRSVETSVLRKALFGLVDKRLLESIHLCDGRELRVFDRGRPYAYRWQTTYGRRETIVPLANITGATLAATDEATQTLTVATDAGELRWLLARDVAGAIAYVEWLSGLAR